MLLLILLLVLVFAGGGGYYGYSRWGTGGGLGIVGTVLLVVVVLYLFGGMHFPGDAFPWVVLALAPRERRVPAERRCARRFPGQWGRGRRGPHSIWAERRRRSIPCQKCGEHSAAFRDQACEHVVPVRKRRRTTHENNDRCSLYCPSRCSGSGAAPGPRPPLPPRPRPPAPGPVWPSPMCRAPAGSSGRPRRARSPRRPQPRARHLCPAPPRRRITRRSPRRARWGLAPAVPRIPRGRLADPGRPYPQRHRRERGDTLRLAVAFYYSRGSGRLLRPEGASRFSRCRTPRSTPRG